MPRFLLLFFFRIPSVSDHLFVCFASLLNCIVAAYITPLPCLSLSVPPSRERTIYIYDLEICCLLGLSTTSASRFRMFLSFILCSLSISV